MRRLLMSGGLLTVIIAGWFTWGNQAQFTLGGALINLGYRLQDPIEEFDLKSHHSSPVEIWEEFLLQNKLASSVRGVFPRTSRHPVIALVACMDARLDTNEIAGDTRRYYYVLRLAGSALSLKDEEMIELAVANGVSVVIFTTHTDCAAERAAKDPSSRLRYPNLTQAVDDREMRFREFLQRPTIRDRVAQGQLLVKWVDLDTNTERAVPHRQ